MSAAAGSFTPLSRRVRRLMVLIATLSLAAAGLMLFVYEIGPSRERAAAEFNSLGKVIAANSAAALTFGDAEHARALLATLATDPSVRFAMLVDAGGRPVAEYRGRAASPAAADSAEPLDDWHRAAFVRGRPDERFDGFDRYESILPVEYAGELQGYVYLNADLDRLYDALSRYALSSAVVTFIAVLLAYLLAGRLEKVITRPIRRLASLTSRVSREGDFSLRAEVESNDEIGQLTEGFNEMLAQIAQRDEALREHRDHLEEEVEERTERLAAANANLEAAVREQSEARAAAEAANTAKSEFLARMSHEIRTPMNGVLGMTELLLGSGLPKKERYFAQTIQQSAESLLTIINDILDFSKIEAGKLELDCVDFDLRQMVEETAELLAAQAHAKQLELIVNMSPRDDYGVRGDPTRLRQVLVNLAGNAIKFTEHGQVVIRVTREDDGQWLIEVTDTGIGIDEKNLASVFDVFTQEDGSTTRQFGGTGLGLSISRQLLELMGGSIGAQSTRGVGSVFSARVPLAASDQVRVVGRADDLADKKALVVDDNRTNREILENQLAAWGVEVRSYHSPEQALQYAADLARGGERFDFVLLDMHMPEMTGLELAERLVGEHGYLADQLILLSSMAANELGGRSADCIGAALTKPVRQSALYDILAASTSATTTRRALRLEEPPVQAAGDRPRRRVLLVEDNTINRRVATMMLQRCNLEVDWCEDGAEAVDRRFSSDCAFILMDCQMPIMDGFVATSRIRKLEAERGSPRMPIIALTANAVSGDRERCLEAGMDDYLSKPFRFEQLREVIERWCGSQDGSAAASSPAPAAAVPADAIDRRIIADLRAMAGDDHEEFLASIIDQFVELSEESRLALQAAADAEDARGIREAAHALKSYSAHLGAQRLARCASEIELAARAESLGGMADRLQLLVTELEHARAALGELRTASAA